MVSAESSVGPAALSGPRPYGIGIFSLRCHCEERSDAAIRNLNAAYLGKEVKTNRLFYIVATNKKERRTKAVRHPFYIEEESK